jgi:hypothetical protein
MKTLHGNSILEVIVATIMKRQPIAKRLPEN